MVINHLLTGMILQVETNVQASKKKHVIRDLIPGPLQCRNIGEKFFAR